MQLRLCQYHSPVSCLLLEFDLLFKRGKNTDMKILCCEFTHMICEVGVIDAKQVRPTEDFDGIQHWVLLVTANGETGDFHYIRLE